MRNNCILDVKISYPGFYCFSFHSTTPQSFILDFVIKSGCNISTVLASLKFGLPRVNKILLSGFAVHVQRMR